VPVREIMERNSIKLQVIKCVRLTTLPPSWAIVTYSGNLNFLELSGHLGPVTGLFFTGDKSYENSAKFKYLEMKILEKKLLQARRNYED